MATDRPGMMRALRETLLRAIDCCRTAGVVLDHQVVSLEGARGAAALKDCGHRSRILVRGIEGTEDLVRALSALVAGASLAEDRGGNPDVVMERVSRARECLDRWEASRG